MGSLRGEHCTWRTCRASQSSGTCTARMTSLQQPRASHESAAPRSQPLAYLELCLAHGYCPSVARACAAQQQHLRLRRQRAWILRSSWWLWCRLLQRHSGVEMCAASSPQARQCQRPWQCRHHRRRLRAAHRRAAPMRLEVGRLDALDSDTKRDRPDHAVLASPPPRHPRHHPRLPGSQMAGACLRGQRACPEWQLCACHWLPAARRE